MALETVFKKEGLEVACDEAGRGCLAGPVVAAAVILDQKNTHPDLDDSKKLSPGKRSQLKDWIMENSQAYAIAFVDQEEIDQINILNASFLAMHRAIDQIQLEFERIIVDGNRFTPYKEKEHHCIVKGDGKYQNIAAASILAKFHRDEFMSKISQKYPQYGWEKNFGYPTQYHREAIKKHGITEYHRKSFRLLPTQLSLYP